MMISTVRPHRFWCGALAPGIALLLLGLALSLQAMLRSPVRPTSAATFTTTVDPRLIIYHKSVSFISALTGPASVDGALWPSLPGLNTISLRILLAAGRVAQGGRVSLVITMPRMRMLPIHASLTPIGQVYRGQVVLPMFGCYRAQVEVATTGGRYSGAISLSLPLALGSSPAGNGSARSQEGGVTP